jgi:bifunctional non-homologous end joining protein LigD
MPTVEREELPRFLSPMLLSQGAPPSGDGWAVEVKWDGIRAQLRFDGRRVCLRSRPGRDCTDQFPELVEIADVLGSRSVILDGELVCLDDEGRPDFGSLRARLAGPARRVNGAARPVTLMTFDVLHLDGLAVRRLSYARRRELLGGLQLDGPVCRTPRYFVGDPDRVVAAVAEQGLEGVVAKRLESVYAEGRRSRAWIKHKLRRRERLVVAGWRERAGALPEFLLARRDEAGRLRPAGSASLGLNADRRATLLEVLAQHELPRGAGRRGGGARWAAPVIEIFVDSHGSPAGPVRDAIMREILVP